MRIKLGKGDKYWRSLFGGIVYPFVVFPTAVGRIIAPALTAILTAVMMCFGAIVAIVLELLTCLILLPIMGILGRVIYLPKEGD